MEYGRWAPVYARIQSDFGLAWPAERDSADALLALLPRDAPTDPLVAVAPRLAGRDAVVVGLAPRSGAPPLWRLPAEAASPVVLAADGAARPCLEAGLVPDVVVTDLDGPVASEVAANARGAFVLVHAHGDNRPALERWVPEFAGPVGGSWAGAPEPRLCNPGGFTDGDRAAYLASAAGVRRILLWGFEFDRTEEADGPARARKLAKLAWAQRLLGLLASGPIPVLLWRRDGSVVPYPPMPLGSTQ